MSNLLNPSKVARYLKALFPQTGHAPTTRLLKVSKLAKRFDVSESVISKLAYALNSAPAGEYRARHEGSDTIRISLRREPAKLTEAVSLSGLGVLTGLVAIVGDPKRFNGKPVALSYDVICHRIGLARATLSKYLKQLEAAGLLKITRKIYFAARRRANLYQLTAKALELVKVRMLPDARQGRPANWQQAKAESATNARPTVHKHLLSSMCGRNKSLPTYVDKERRGATASRLIERVAGLVARQKMKP